MAETILGIKNVTKRFPGVVALKDVSFDVQKGEIHALVGENGAGKSTLIKILSGVNSLEEGEIYLRGEQVKFAKLVVHITCAVTGAAFYHVGKQPDAAFAGFLVQDVYCLKHLAVIQPAKPLEQIFQFFHRENHFFPRDVSYYNTSLPKMYRENRVSKAFDTRFLIFFSCPSS